MSSVTKGGKAASLQEKREGPCIASSFNFATFYSPKEALPFL